MANNNKDKLSERFNMEPKMNAEVNKIDENERELNKQKILKYLRSTSKYEMTMQKEREIIDMKNMGTTMQSLLDMDPNLRRLAYDKKTGISDRLIKHTETMAKQRIVNTLARKQLGPFKYAFITGKFGIDTFFLLFAAVGMFAIPAYFFTKNYKLRNKLKMVNKKKNFEDEDGDIDIDDVSYDFTNMRVDEIRKEQLKQATISAEVRKLEDELYGKRH